MAHPVVEKIRSGVCGHNRYVLSSELKPKVNMLAKKYPPRRWAWVARNAPKRLGVKLFLIILGLGFASSPYPMWRPTWLNADMSSVDQQEVRSRGEEVSLPRKGLSLCSRYALLTCS